MILLSLPVSVLTFRFISPTKYSVLSILMFLSYHSVPFYYALKLIAKIAWQSDYIFEYEHYNWKVCKTWSVMLRRDHRWVLEEGMVSTTSGPKWDKVTDGWRGLHSKELTILTLHQILQVNRWVWPSTSHTQLQRSTLWATRILNFCVNKDMHILESDTLLL